MMLFSKKEQVLRFVDQYGNCNEVKLTNKARIEDDSLIVGIHTTIFGFKIVFLFSKTHIYSINHVTGDVLREDRGNYASLIQIDQYLYSITNES